MLKIVKVLLVNLKKNDNYVNGQKLQWIKYSASIFQLVF